MNVHEWPLTLFTILGQMAVGAFWTLGVIQILGTTKFGRRAVSVMTPPALYAIGPAMVLGLAGSTLHLGNIMNAPNAVRHVSTSPLAREIVFGAGFAVLGFIFALIVWMDWLNQTWRTIIATFIAIWGVAFIFVMSSVYLIPTVPAWNHWTTPAQFVTTAALLGTLAMGVAYTWYPFLADVTWIQKIVLGKNAHNKVDLTVEDSGKVAGLIRSTVKWIGIAAMVLLVIELVITVFSMMRPDVSNNPPQVPFDTTAFVIRMVLLVIGAGGLGYYLSIQGKSKPVATPSVPAGAAFAATADKRLAWLVTVAFVLVLISETIGRFMFYGAIDRIGI